MWKQKAKQKSAEVEQLENQLSNETEIEEPSPRIPTVRKAIQSDFPIKVAVVAQLPTQQIKRIKTESGEVVELVTIEEALTELLNAYRKGE